MYGSRHDNTPTNKHYIFNTATPNAITEFLHIELPRITDYCTSLHTEDTCDFKAIYIIIT